MRQYNLNTGFYAEIIADSINPTGSRLTTYIITLPRIVLAEFNTHRMLSRNSASSRAIPFNKMLKRCKETPFIPLKFMRDHKGMQGAEYFKDEEEGLMHDAWLHSRDEALLEASSLNDMGLTKQLCNRLLEPFMWHTIIATGCGKGWQNFFALRAHEAAEIHIQKAAYMMLDAYNESTPKRLEWGKWHIPFGDTFDDMRLTDLGIKLRLNNPTLKLMISTARCARVSYLNFEGKDDYEADVNLYNILSEQGHWSPFEHCAAAIQGGDGGNFGINWLQHRKQFEGECRKDARVNI